ncbi:sugar ABC transporter permease [Bacillus sp. 03113]|uniref:sugar ABC transporter permease n=1 Tax=Bacillus sp. 03113 TaxID=2578211 RepID=UPI00114359FB|nr:sugar ABC transporter permease [Bacillus sp. 03113]
MLKTKKRVQLTLSYLALIIIAIFCLYPAIWVILASLRPGTSLYSETLIPTKITFDHYLRLFTAFPFAQWYFNTIKIAVISMICGTISTLITGYIFSTFRFTGRKNIMNSLLVLGLFPGFMSMIAIYILLTQMNLLNTHFAIIIVYVAGAPLGFLFAKNFFDTMPKGIIEAARIDGAGHMLIFLKIILPLSKPLIVYTSLMAFNAAFTDFIFAKLVLRSPEKKTLAVGLFDMLGENTAPEFTVFAAGCVMIAVPVTLLFIFMQRYLIEGITAGADKG